MNAGGPSCRNASSNYRYDTVPLSPKATRILRPLVILCVFVLLFPLMFRAFEHSQVYHPSFGSESAVTDAHPDGNDFFLTGKEGQRLHAWYLPGKTTSTNKQYVFLFCHGNGGNLTGRPGYYRAIMSTGAALLAFDYRGYGKSEGSPGEEETYQDAFAAYDWLISLSVEPKHIIVWGESLGGAIASKVALEKEVGGLVLQSTFTSVPDIGAKLFPFLPVRTLASIHYDTNKRLPDIKCPVVVMHSQVDEIIPWEHGQKNFATANEPKQFVELQGGHNNALYASQAQYIAGAEAAIELNKKHLP